MQGELMITMLALAILFTVVLGLVLLDCLVEPE
jgi:hypothetical protein